MTSAPEPASAGATLLVEGCASAEVMPDSFTAIAHLRSATAAAAPEALGEVAASRRALLDHLRARHPQAAIADTAIAIREHVVQIEERGRTDVRVEGVYAVASVSVRVPAAEAAAVLASAGAFPDTARLDHAFEVAAPLEQATRLELQAEAIRDARRRAAVLAEAAGLRVVAIASIGEADAEARHHELAFMAKGARYADEADAILAELGELRPEPDVLEERVRVRFRLA